MFGPIRRQIFFAIVVLLTLASVAAFAETATSTISAPATVTTQVTVDPGSAVTIDIGQMVNQIIIWAATAFGTVIGGAIMAVIVRVFKLVGLKITDELRTKLQQIIVNGINVGAAEIADRLKDRGQIEVKNAIVARAVEYTKEHGQETIKRLGLDPNGGAVVEAIKARIETAIADPTTPTPAAITPVPVSVTRATEVAPAPANPLPGETVVRQTTETTTTTLAPPDNKTG